MNTGNLKQILKATWGWFAFFFWMFLIAITLASFYLGWSTGTKITLVASSIVGTVAGWTLLSKSISKQEKQEAEAKEKRLQELKKRYKEYIDLVNVQVQETLKKSEKEMLNAFDIDTSLKYLFSFDDYTDWVCRNRIVGKPDSFILASCLIYSIVDHPIIKPKIEEKNTRIINLIFRTNLVIAMNCALQIISEPFTYYADKFVLKEQKHPKVTIVVPNGLVKDSDLYERIICTIHSDKLRNNRTSIMQLSNVLHLIYLNCQ